MPNTTPLYDGTDSGPIDLATARQWVQNFKGNAQPGEIQSHYFGRNIIDKILSQPGCTGIRILHAANEKGERQIIIAGVDNKGANMTSETGSNTLAEFSWPCPPLCLSTDL